MAEAAQLAAAIAAGDRDAERTLVDTYSRGIETMLRVRCGDGELARDLTHDTLELALHKLRAGDIENAQALPGFLRGMALNLLRNGRRRQGREVAVDPQAGDALLSAAGGDEGGLSRVLRNERRALVEQLLAELAVERDRELLQRFYLDDEDKDELCRRFGIDSAHFNRVLHRARQRLRKLAESSARRGTLKVEQ